MLWTTINSRSTAAAQPRSNNPCLKPVCLKTEMAIVDVVDVAASLPAGHTQIKRFTSTSPF